MRHSRLWAFGGNGAAIFAFGDARNDLSDGPQPPSDSVRHVLGNAYTHHCEETSGQHENPAPADIGSAVSVPDG
ncbi:hypothetical protein JOF56_009029 [Kibdelosporangium banguiense]|uniref:Uncharacterized protein n=1 Tax=Kibdelosporangium banguiense TaxID=1365924 RepID=A0ABS4TXD0_9PSEU|nr:hypothetical protein [Kibdelosporangium banguiense]MBP2328644.1 hypothetical protein [Kibdelosporangium banguiense]